MPRFRSLATILVLASLVVPADAQDPGRPPLNREQMWPAPTAEDWAKPCLVTWQRTWDDAVAVSKETGKPILVCVNMDGEIASEHYAGVRYRDPEVAKLYEPYVCVIASTYRHNPRDHDDQGRRIPCPRFGTVTCGEHIWIEPIVYEKFLDGTRVAPRHIMVELDGSEVYDVYYRNDVASVLEDVRKGIADRKVSPKPVVRGDRSLAERVASPDVRDRMAVESAYLDGDAERRRSLLEAAAKQEGAAPLDLLRLAIFGLDDRMSRLARAALAKSESPDATQLIVDAMRAPLEPGERKALIDALERLGEKSPRARWLAMVQEGLVASRSLIDLKGWTKGGGTYQPPPMLSDIEELEGRREGAAAALRDSPEDAESCLDLAETSLALALKARHVYADDPEMSRVFARHLFEDARLKALRAAELGADAWRSDMLVALACYYRGDVETAFPRAEAAVEAMPPGETSWNAMALLTIFAEGRYKAIKQAARAGERWSPEWLADLDAAYTALLSHPLSTEDQAIWYLDFLEWLTAGHRASRFLSASLERFPGSAALHQRLRMQILRQRGAEELAAAYDRMLADHPGSPAILWYAGYATIVVADFHRRAGRADEALEGYSRAIGLFDRAAEADSGYRDSADHFAALALAGRARLYYERGDDETASAEIVASFERRPETAGEKDDIGITPAETAQMLIARLKENGREELVETIVAALGKLDPEALVPKED